MRSDTGGRKPTSLKACSGGIFIATAINFIDVSLNPRWPFIALAICAVDTPLFRESSAWVSPALVNSSVNHSAMVFIDSNILPLGKLFVGSAVLLFDSGHTIVYTIEN